MEDIKKEINPEEPKEKELPKEPKIQILITFNPVDRKVDVAGPLHDRGLCYMMLELAHEAIYEFKNQKPVIEKHSILNFARRK